MTARPVRLRILDPAWPGWEALRGDPASAFLPWELRELIAGRVPEVIGPPALAARLRALAGGLHAAHPPAGPLVGDEPAPEPAPPAAAASPRALIAAKLADLVAALGATQPFGGEVLRAASGRFYCVPFAAGRAAAGVLEVYGPGFVRAAYAADWPGLPESDSRVFGSPDDAARFLTLLFHARDPAAALAVPLRPRRPQKSEPGGAPDADA